MRMRPVLCAMLSIGTLSAMAEEPTTAEPTIKPLASAIVQSHTYLFYHPDLRWQLQGLAHLDAHDYEQALVAFKNAARYGDKGAQAMVAEIYWKGLGRPPDRALAYAWMDLAATRHSRKLSLLREYYWQQLDAEERARALTVGREIAAMYRDELTFENMRAALQRFQRHQRMSRAMSAGVSSHRLMLAGGGSISVRRFGGANDPHWNPALYVRWRDAFFENPGGGQVEVGELQTVPAEPAIGTDD